MSHRSLHEKAAARSDRAARKLRAEEKLRNMIPDKLAAQMNARFQELLALGYSEARAADKTHEEYMALAKEIRASHAG